MKTPILESAPPSPPPAEPRHAGARGRVREFERDLERAGGATGSATEADADPGEAPAASGATEIDPALAGAAAVAGSAVPGVTARPIRDADTLGLPGPLVGASLGDAVRLGDGAAAHGAGPESDALGAASSAAVGAAGSAAAGVSGGACAGGAVGTGGARGACGTACAGEGQPLAAEVAEPRHPSAASGDAAGRAALQGDSGTHLRDGGDAGGPTSSAAAEPAAAATGPRLDVPAPLADAAATPRSSDPGAGAATSADVHAAPRLQHEGAADGAVLRNAAHLRIDAPGLGDIELHLRVRDGVAHLRMDGDAARLVESRAAELSRALAGEGLKLGHLEARPTAAGASWSSGEAPPGPPGQDGRRQHSGRDRDAPPAAATPPLAPRRASAPTAAPASGGRVAVRA